MIKFILSLIIILAGFTSGQLKAKSYDNRVVHLDNLLTTLKILQSEMTYRLDPLGNLLLRISGLIDGSSASLFEKAGSLLKDHQSREFSQCWDQAVEAVYKESSLTNKDKLILRDFGLELGRTDMGSQHSLFARTFALLDAQIVEATEEKKTKGKMYKSLGASLGFLVVIVLI